MGLQYNHEIKKYGRKDAIIALCLCAYYFGILFLQGLLIRLGSPLPGLLLDFIVFILVLLPFFAILLWKDDLASIGLHREKLGVALRLGLVISLLAFIVTVLPRAVGGWELASFNTVLSMFFLAVIVAFLEDTFFSGYLQTRIYGLIKNDVAAVLMVAFLFALSHVPVHVGLFGVSALSVMLSGQMLFWMIFHILYNQIYRRYFSLYPVLMMHFSWNFSGSGLFYRPDDFAGFANSFVNFAYTFQSYIFALVIGIWAIVTWYIRRKTDV